MLTIRKTLFTAFSLLFGSLAFAAVPDLPVQTIGGKECYVYRVQPKEGELAICHKLEITRDQLHKYNPDVKKGLKADQLLTFPVADFQKRLPVGDYKAKKGDTLYGISKQFKMTQDEFLALNPQAESGVKENDVYKVYGGQVSQPAQPAQETVPATRVATDKSDDKNAADASAGKHTIAEHESLYQIAHSYGITLENLLALNPGLDATHYQAGTVINVPEKKADDSVDPGTKVADAFSRKAEKYTVKPGDTFYGIARAHGITIEQLQNANPGINLLQEGMEIDIPQACDEQQPAPGVLPGSGELPVVIENQLPDQSKSRLTVALVLPFNAGAKEHAKASRQYAEFYKGFMMGVDSMRQCGRPITVMAFDTKGTAEGFDEALANNHLEEAQVIIAPDNAEQISRLADFASQRHISVLNLFLVKDTAYMAKPAVMQANIPLDNMVDRAMAYGVDMAADFTPVILSKRDAKEKREIVDRFVKELKAKGIEPVEIDYTESITAADLKALKKNGKYMFVPVVSRQAELNNVLPALVDFRKEMTDPDPTRLMGYPEWITYRGKTLENMKAPDTYIYSRFYFSPSDAIAKDIDELFAGWYGSGMQASLPRQGLLGFDVAMYLIRELSLNEGDFDKYSGAYDGVQNPFRFRRAGGEGAGWVNDEFYIVNFRPSGMVDKLAL